VKRPKLNREWVGLRCTMRYPITWHSGDALPIGAVVTVTGTGGTNTGGGGLYIRTESEPRIGGRCSPTHLEPVERVAPPEPARKRRS
jgi:hypothetical protein